MTTSAQASLLRSSHQARAAYRQRRSSNANSLCSQKSARSRESDLPFKGIFYDDGQGNFSIVGNTITLETIGGGQPSELILPSGTSFPTAVSCQLLPYASQ